MNNQYGLDADYFIRLCAREFNPDVIRNQNPEDLARAFARAARTACKEVLAEAEFAAPAGVPDGWKLVPVEPTPEMVDVALKWGTKRSEWHELLAAAPVPVPAAQDAARLEKLLTDEDRSHGLTIDQRDRAEEWATKIAEAVGEHFGSDVGEHSSANCPWENAMELLNTATPAAEQQDAVKVPRELLAELCSLDHDTRIQGERRLLALLAKEGE